MLGCLLQPRALYWNAAAGVCTEANSYELFEVFVMHLNATQSDLKRHALNFLRPHFCIFLRPCFGDLLSDQFEKDFNFLQQLRLWFSGIAVIAHARPIPNARDIFGIIGGELEDWRHNCFPFAYGAEHDSPRRSQKIWAYEILFCNIIIMIFCIYFE